MPGKQWLREDFIDAVSGDHMAREGSLDMRYRDLEKEQLEKDLKTRIAEINLLQADKKSLELRVKQENEGKLRYFQEVRDLKKELPDEKRVNVEHEYWLAVQAKVKSLKWWKVAVLWLCASHVVSGLLHAMLCHARF